MHAEVAADPATKPCEEALYIGRSLKLTQWELRQRFGQFWNRFRVAWGNIEETSNLQVEPKIRRVACNYLYPPNRRQTRDERQALERTIASLIGNVET